MRFAAILACLLSAASARAATLSIYVDANSSDMIGQQVIYYLKQDIISSSQFRIAYVPKQSDYEISMVTLEDSHTYNSELSTAYSAVFVRGTILYIDNLVGICGSFNVKSCAASILASFGHDVDSLR